MLRRLYGLLGAGIQWFWKTFLASNSKWKTLLKAVVLSILMFVIVRGGWILYVVIRTAWLCTESPVDVSVENIKDSPVPNKFHFIYGFFDHDQSRKQKNARNEEPSPIPQRFIDTVNEWRSMMPDMDTKIWYPDDGDELIFTEFPWLWPTYSNYMHPVQKVDALRYAILYSIGGVYLDLDIRPCRSLNPVMGSEIMIPRTAPMGYSNDMLWSRPYHPFYLQVLRELVSNDKWYVFPYVTVFFSTGPAFLTEQALHYPEKNKLYIMPFKHYGLHCAGGSLIRHVKGNAWHEWDADYLFWIHEHPILFFGVLFTVLFFAVTLRCWIRGGVRVYRSIRRRVMTFVTIVMIKLRFLQKNSNSGADPSSGEQYP